MPTLPTDLCDLTARDLIALIRRRTVSSREVMAAHLTRVEQVNQALNAIVTLVPDAALDGADRADAALARGDEVGPLHGLPVAHKDLFVTSGLRTTFGSRVFADQVPDHTALIVERERQAGAITIGKTNTPEFGAGSQTFNAVFGAIRTPYDPTKTCGGSSGGAAVALATGMVPIADGSDLGGSLRNPASFCNVVGLRCSPGRVPRWPSVAPWFPFDVHGPMARTVGDVALLLDAIAGPDPRAPLSLGVPGARFADALDRDFDGVRIAWSPDLGGLPVETAVTQVLDRHRTTLESLGCVSLDGHPDLRDADEIFITWRAWYYELAFGQVLDRHRHLVWLRETLQLGGDLPLKAGLLTFGGAYTVIPFLQEAAVESHGWLTEDQFIDGLALGGVLPAPLIIFSTFVGYLAGGLTGALLMTFGIFLPAFLFPIFFHRQLVAVAENPRVRPFLLGVAAAVIGLIAAVTVDILRTSVVDVFTGLLAAVAFFVLYRWHSKVTVVAVVLGCGVVGALWQLV